MKVNIFYFIVFTSVFSLQGQCYISYVQDCDSNYENLEWVESFYLRNLKPEVEFLEYSDIDRILDVAQKKLSRFSPYLSDQVFLAIEKLKIQTRIDNNISFLLPPAKDYQILKPGCSLKIVAAFQGQNLFIEKDIWRGLTTFQKASLYLGQGLFQVGIQYPLASRLFVTYWLSGQMESFSDQMRSEFYRKMGLKFFEIQSLRVNLNESNLTHKAPQFFPGGEIKSGYALEGSLITFDYQKLFLKDEFLFYKPKVWAFFNVDYKQVFKWIEHSFYLKKILFFESNPNQIQSIIFSGSLNAKLNIHPRVQLEQKGLRFEGHSPLQVDFFESGKIQRIHFLSPPWVMEVDLKIQSIRAGVPLELGYSQNLKILFNQEGEVQCLEGIQSNQKIFWEQGEVKSSPYFQNLCFSPRGEAQGLFRGDHVHIIDIQSGVMR